MRESRESRVEVNMEHRTWNKDRYAVGQKTAALKDLLVLNH
jgi:hypothetical protein